MSLLATICFTLCAFAFLFNLNERTKLEKRLLRLERNTGRGLRHLKAGEREIQKEVQRNRDLLHKDVPAWNVERRQRLFRNDEDLETYENAGLPAHSDLV